MQPSSEWTTEALGLYAVEKIEGGVATRYYLAGHALHLARGRIRHGGWISYLAMHGICRMKANRAIRLYRSDATVEKLEGLSLDDALNEFCPPKARTKTVGLPAIQPGGDTGEITLLQGDCVEVMSSMSAESFDVIVCSPPYNLGVKYGVYRDRMPHDAYLDWTQRWVSEARRLLKPEGTLWVNVGSYPTQPWVADDVKAVCRRHLKIQNQFVWVKSAILDGKRRGQYIPVPGERFVNVLHEHVYQFSKTGSVRLDRYAEGVGQAYTDPKNRHRTKSGRDLTCGGSVWFIPHLPRTRKAMHPAQFPPALPERCIRLHGVRPGMRVLDPFGGVSNTAVACKKLGVSCTTIEIDPHYVALARIQMRSISITNGLHNTRISDNQETRLRMLGVIDFHFRSFN